jgi:hypothetical protein
MNDERVDELRQQLKALGYLDAGVDRFVLGGTRERRGPIAVAARTSVRVGLLGGALLGPSAALGLGARLPGLLGGARDAAVLALYLAVFFLATIAAASFVVSLAASFARAGSRAAAWIVSAGALAYLTLWWRNANAGFGWSAPAWTAFALLVAVAISLLVGHAVRIATLAVFAARATGAELPPVATRSWRVIAAGGALAFAGAAVLLMATTSADGAAPAAAPHLAVVSKGATVKVLAIDGIDPTLADTRAWARPWGYRGVRFAVDYGDTADPARTWTTVATGELPDVHGIHAIAGRRVAGLRGMLSPEASGTGRVLQQATDLIRLTQPSIASRAERRVMTFWEVAAAAGLRGAVFNWWATWPATASSGIVVSDRAVLRLEHGGAPDAEISPAAAYADLRSHWPQITRDAQTLAARRFADLADRDVAAILVRSATLDAIVLGMDTALAEKNRDLDVVYLPGLDIAQHAFFGERDRPAPSASALAARLAALRAYHDFLGELVGPWLRPLNTQIVVIITAPGRVASNGAGQLTVGTWRAPPAMDTLSPPRNMDAVDAEPPFDEVPNPVGSVDIAPTVLNLLGIPISRELPGIALPASPLAPPTGRFVATYGRPATEDAARGGRPLDQETIDRLRSLGYIK